MKAMIKLAEAGFPISIKKCDFLAMELSYLGLILAEKRFALGKKSLQNILAGDLPTSIREVRGLLGKLNFTSNFVLNYAKLVAPIVSLLGKSGGGVWKAEHTESLNHILEIVMRHIQLGYYDLQLPVYLHVDEDGTYLTVTLI